MDKLKYIHHISDIQIRNLKRHKEYNEVFERTYKEIEKYKDDLLQKLDDDLTTPSMSRMLAGQSTCQLNNTNFGSRQHNAG